MTNTQIDNSIVSASFIVLGRDTCSMAAALAIFDAVEEAAYYDELSGPELDRLRHEQGMEMLGISDNLSFGRCKCGETYCWNAEADELDPGACGGSWCTEPVRAYDEDMGFTDPSAHAEHVFAGSHYGYASMAELAADAAALLDFPADADLPF